MILNRSIKAKVVQSTKLNAWSGNVWAMCHAAQLDRLWDHDGDSRCSQGFPEGKGRRSAQVGIEESPRFRDDEVGGNERCPSRMLGIETARLLMMAI